MDNRIYVIANGTDDAPVSKGQIVAEVGMQTTRGEVTAVANDIVTCSGDGNGASIFFQPLGANNKFYSHDVYMLESEATGYGYPTGTTSFPFV